VTWIRNHVNDMNGALNATDYTDPVTGYAKYIDVDSWVDHHLLNVLALNADALRLSTYFFKTRDGKIEFGPIWDFDRSMESTDSRDNNPSTWSGGTNYFTYPWWSRLFTDENFWQNYIDRYFELRDESWSTANIHAIIDGMAAELNESQVRNFQRWSDQPRFGSYQGEVDHLKDWLGTRLNWMDGQFAPRPNSNRAAGIHAPGTTVTLNASLTGGQKIFYTLDGSDPRPQSDTGTVSGSTLFDETQPIRVLVPTTDIGTTWRGGNEPFNDSTWIAGINGVGYERSSGYENFINVDVDSEMAGRTTCYIRIPFNVDGAELATWNFMTLQMRYDDGFVAYLNGTRLVGSNDPSPLLFSSSAVQTNDDGSAVSYENFNVTALLGSLQAGQNILAIHALNESTGSSDFLNQSRIVAGFDEGGGNGTGGIEYTGPITLTGTSRLFARVFDPSGGHSTNSGQTPVGTGWSAPLEVEYLVNEVPANSSNLIISEIMHDPYDLGDALTEDGAFEWIELQNISGGPISLTGVRFLDGIEFVFPGRSLSAGERVLVVRNQAAFEQVYGTGRSTQIAGQFDLALDNLGELLILTAANGAVIQSFAYSNSGGWPAEADNGYSLQFEAGDPADGANWLASRSLLGSPGTEDPSSAALADIFVNGVLSNSVTPLVDEIELYNPNIGDLNVGGWFLTDDLSQPEKFRIPDNTMVPGGGFLTFDESDFNPTPGVGMSFALDSFGEEVFLIAATPTGNRLDYLSGFDFGDASAGVTYGRHVISTGAAHHVPLVSATLGNANSTPVAGPLVITELMYHPAPFESEFVEIQNISGQAIPLANAEVSGIGFVFDAGAPPLAPGGIVVLSQIDPDTFRSTYNVPAAVAVYGPYPGNLDNGGERVRVGIP
ncbi:MAG: lamin tail domain-containing protein, partial [Roseibacillus sp.]